MKNTRFVVYCRDTGGLYLALRKSRKSVTEPKYTWCKDRARAIRLTADRARRLASNYFGDVRAVWVK
jgi:hypothetical protein